MLPVRSPATPGGFDEPHPTVYLAEELRHERRVAEGPIVSGRELILSPTIHRATRIDFEMPVELRFEDSEDVVAGRSVNISETGMLVVSPVPSPRGTLVRFEFTHFAGKGAVVWTGDADQGTYWGIRFHPLTPKARRVLLELLDASG